MFINPTPTMPAEASEKNAGSVLGKQLPAADSLKSGKVEKAITEFESLFLSMMIKELRQTSSGDGLFPGDGSDTYGGMFDMFLGHELAAGKGLGLESVFRSSTAISQFEKYMGQSRSLMTRDTAMEGYHHEQLRASSVAIP